MTVPQSDQPDFPQPSVFDKLLAPIDGFARNQSESLPAHHNQKYSYYDFFRLVMYFFASGAQSLRMFTHHLAIGLFQPCLRLAPMPYSTFNDSFQRFAPELFQDVFRYMLSSVSFKNIPEMAALGMLYCIDGSLFPIISSMHWAGYTSKHQALKLHLCFELNRMIPVGFMVTAANFGEREALKNMVCAGVTYIADRGYFAFHIFEYINSENAFFVIRAKEGLLYSVTKILPVTLPGSVCGMFENVTDELISYTNDKSKNTYRLVRFAAGFENCTIVTNRLDLTVFQIIMLYAYRWQIELLFRFLKRTMNGIHLIKNDQKGVTVQFYALLIVALLELHLKQELIDSQEEKQTVSSEKPDFNPNRKLIDSQEEKQTVSSEKPEFNPNLELIENQEEQQTVSSEKSKPDDEVKENGNSTAEKILLHEKADCETPGSSVDKSANKPEHKNNKSPPQRLPCSYEFFRALGQELHNYWKTGIRWLTSLQHLLDKHFDIKAINILNSS